MNNTLLDNSDKFLMRDWLRKMISSELYDHICIATGYWDLPGMQLLYDQLKPFLDRGGRLDILIGQEPLLRSYQVQSSEEEQFPDFYLQRDINLLTDEYRPTAELIQQYCKVMKYDAFGASDIEQGPSDGEQDDSQIQIRVYGQDAPEHKQFLHAKCYIFLGEGEADGIIGSSNFTQKGLEDNAELNYLETNNSTVTASWNEFSNSKSHKAWFDEKWEQSVCWNGKFLKILSSAPVGKLKPKQTQPVVQQPPLTPYELYIKLLQHKFGDLIDADTTQTISDYLPQKYMPLEFQIDAVKQCFSIMKTHGGFMLADVVGLGKTIVGLLIIKHFLNYPDDGRARKVLVITPPAIKGDWLDTIDDFDKDSPNKVKPLIDFVTTGSIGSLVDDDADTDSGDFEDELKYNDYGLILIDESHKFRNSDTQMYKSLDDLINQIGTNMGCYPYVGLLSATPQNNTPEDLKNQIYLFERNRKYCTLDKVSGRNLEAFFSSTIKEFNQLRNEANKLSANPNPTLVEKQLLDKVNNEFKEISTTIRKTILCDILVRRTRTDIKKYYAADVEKSRLRFPNISGPHSLKYNMDPMLAQLFADTMDLIANFGNIGRAGTLGYYRYRAIQYLKSPDNRRKYEGRGSRSTQVVADQLAKIMQVLLVKRLESSFSAFTQSLRNLRTYTQNMIDMWDNNAIFVCPQIDVNAELDRAEKSKKRGRAVTFNECADDIRLKIKNLTKQGRNDKGQNAEYTQNDFDPSYIDLIKADFVIIRDLCDRWAQNSEDPKLDKFKDSLKPELFNPETNTEQKLVIFTEALDTVKTLERACINKGYRVLTITAKNRKEKRQEIKENFDANYGERKGEVRRNEYDIIITTEVLAEGVNLHRANVILNYDTPWNSTRLMQRIGRVNRIGSTASNVYVYNFMPSAEGDQQIQLVEKAHIKIQSFHTLFGEDSKVFTDDETVMQYGLTAMVNGTTSPYEKYIYELKQYRQNYPDRYKYICQKEDDLQMAVQTPTGDSYFVVRQPKTSGLFVRVGADGKGTILSGLDFYPAFFSSVSMQRGTLPDDWNARCKQAIRTVGQHLAQINNYKGNNEAATKAKGIIDNMRKNAKLSDASLHLLAQAFDMIKKGNSDIIRTVISIGNNLFSDQMTLFPLSQDEIDSLIAQKLEYINNDQFVITGRPEVYMGLAK